MRALSTITPAETVRLLRKYLEYRKEGETQKVYGIREGNELVYWSCNSRDAKKKAERWGLTSEYLGSTTEELGAYTK